MTASSRNQSVPRQPASLAGRNRIVFANARAASTTQISSRIGIDVSQSSGSRNSSPTANGQASANNTHQINRTTTVFIIFPPRFGHTLRHGPSSIDEAATFNTSSVPKLPRRMLQKRAARYNPQTRAPGENLIHLFSGRGRDKHPVRDESFSLSADGRAVSTKVRPGAWHPPEGRWTASPRRPAGARRQSVSLSFRAPGLGPD